MKRKLRVNVTLNDDDKKIIEREAKKSRLPVATLVRKIVADAVRGMGE